MSGSRNPTQAIKKLQESCRRLPGATEDMKWEHHLVFPVGGKMFALFEMSAELPFSFKASPEAFGQLVCQSGIIAAPYLARAQWVQVQQDGALPLELLQELLEEAHLIVASRLPKKTQRQLGLLEE